jgi:hypothetical protein
MHSTTQKVGIDKKKNPHITDEEIVVQKSNNLMSIHRLAVGEVEEPGFLSGNCARHSL